MKVLVVPSWHPTPDRPHWCTWILPHITASKESGADVFVLQVDIVDSPQEVKSKFLSESHYYTSIYIKHFSRLRNLVGYYYINWRYLGALKNAYSLVRGRWGDADLIHAHVSLPAGLGSSYLGESIGVPVVLTEHYSGFQSDMRFFWRLRHHLKAMGKKLSIFSAVSSGFASRITGTGIRQALEVLPNPIDCDLFNSVEAADVLAVDPLKGLRLVTVASSIRIKGVDVLLRALADCRDKGILFHLNLVGPVVDAQGLGELITKYELGDLISIRGVLNKQALRDCYNQSDAYIVSSRSETANVSMLEAMACGAVVITTRCGGPETLLSPRVSLICEPECSRGLAIAVEQYSEESTKYSRVTCRQFVLDNYSVPELAQKLAKIYRKVYENKN